MAEEKLRPYKDKRDFSKTTEPAGAEAGRGAVFVVQRHDASHLHFDFRLEIDGVLKSWAVPKGPPTQPKEKRLAIAVEDHPVEYADFEGTIPAGQYGAGTVEIWDHGVFRPVSGEAAQGLADGKLAFILEGKRLRGEYALVKTGMTAKSWLLIAANK